MKNVPDKFSMILHVYKYLLLKQWFYTVSRTNMHSWNIFLIEALSMLTSPQIKMVKLLNKKPGISDRSSFCVSIALNLNWFERNCVTTFPWRGCFESMLAYVIPQQNYQKSFVSLNKMCLMVRFIKTTTCRCPQLKLSPLSTQINIYCLMTNQTPVFLVQCAPWMRAAVMLLQSLNFSAPPPPEL